MAYTYDQLGNRLTKTARDGSGVITKLTEYAYDVTAPDENLPTHNNRLLRYLEYVPGEAPALGGTPAFVRTRTYTAGSGTEIDEASGGRLQRHSDLIGSTVCTSDDSGAAQPPSNRPVYTAFGELVAGSQGSRYGYAGDHGYEGAAGPAPGGAVVLPGAPGAEPIILLHVGARHYDPAVGRFIQRDPIGIGGGPNVYLYCFANPVCYFDVDGHVPQSVANWWDNLKAGAKEVWQFWTGGNGASAVGTGAKVSLVVAGAAAGAAAVLGAPLLAAFLGGAAIGYGIFRLFGSPTGGANGALDTGIDCFAAGLGAGEIGGIISVGLRNFLRNLFPRLFLPPRSAAPGFLRPDIWVSIDPPSVGSLHYESRPVVLCANLCSVHSLYYIT